MQINSKIKAKRNLSLLWWISFISWLNFLVPVITLLYKYTWLSTAEIVFIANIATLWITFLELPTSVFADTYGFKRSLVMSVFFNFLSAVMILFYPEFWWFCLASFFASLYWCFWSGTGQAFLDENLRVLWKEKNFWKIMGAYMSYENLSSIVTPLVASAILKFFGDYWYNILAILDVWFSFILVVMTLNLYSMSEFENEKLEIKKAILHNIKTWTIAINNIIKNSTITLILLYRTLSHHLWLLFLMILPILKGEWMMDWYWWFVIALWSIVEMLSLRYWYKFSEKYTYNFSWVFSSVSQAIILVLIGVFYHTWWLVVILYVVFLLFQGLIDPAWNHILVHHTKWKSVATTRSIIFSILALYMTIWKQISTFYPLDMVFVTLWIFMIIVNFILGRKMMSIK